jgi:DNA polymerase-1
MSKLLLIDGMSAAYRAFYAIRGLTNSRGQPTNAVFGFVKMLLKIVKEYDPQYLAIAADSRGPTFRHDRFEEYKAQRKPMPEDLAGQLPLIREAAAGYRFNWLAVPGYEADDILATLALRAAREGMETFILTGDKDLLQLVDDRIKVISPHQDGTLFDRKAVEERFGVPPGRLAGVLALMGDAIDNVPGVPGIGEKTAVKLIQKYRDLEGVLNHAAEVKNKRVRENLVKYADQARLSRELVKLRQDVPLKWELSELKREEPDREKLRELFAKLEFKELFRELSPESGEKIDYVLIEGEGAASSLAQRIESSQKMFLHLKASRALPLEENPVSLALAGKKREKIYLPLKKEKAKKEMLPLLRPYLESEEVKKCLHDAKLTSELLLAEGIELKGVAWDTMLVSYLLNPSRSDHSLETIAWDYLGWTPPALSREACPEAEEGDVLCRRLEAIIELESKLREELKEKNLNLLLTDMELPLSRVLVKMERNGITVDCSRLEEMSRDIQKELDALARKMFEAAGEEFNLNSPRQLSRILFDKLKLPPQKKTKTGYSTDVIVLRALAERHELPALILEYRGLFKLKSTYIDALPGLVDPRNGRIHTTFHQVVTATGRLSSSSPNLQNIPVRTELGKKIRSAFVPRPEGWIFLSADYSQVDLRVLAHLSQDPLLLEAFHRNEDIHAFTASAIFGVKIEEVTSEMRRRAKTVNFGIIYGMGAYGLARDLEISYSEAEAFIDAYFKRYVGVTDYIKKELTRAKQRGYVTTIFHRRRYLPELESPQENVRRFGERTAINTPIQGSAADIIKLAMINIDRRMEKEGLSARMLLQIHDELLFETPEEEIEPLSRLVREEMEGVVKLKVELKTDLKAGKNWGELEPLNI